jgi:hypothetical protein
MFGGELVPELVDASLRRLLLRRDAGALLQSFVGHAGSSRVRSGDVNHVQVGSLGVHGQFLAWLRMPRDRDGIGERMASIGGPIGINKGLVCWSRGLSRSIPAQSSASRRVYFQQQPRPVSIQVGRSESGASRCIHPGARMRPITARRSARAPISQACHARPDAPKGGQADQASTHPSCTLLHRRINRRASQHGWDEHPRLVRSEQTTVASRDPVPPSEPRRLARCGRLLLPA